ncbi:Dicer-like protein 1 [Mortierella sp. AD094]|nr:Dicer-like protein 1 [Mortierella sp. AD094]
MPKNGNCPLIEATQPTRHLAMSVTACILCVLLIQRQELDTNMNPTKAPLLAHTTRVFGNVTLTEQKQKDLGLEFIKLEALHKALAICSTMDISHSWGALGEAFLKFFFAAYFFAHNQDESEGALTTRIQNESCLAVISSYITASGLVVYTCTQKGQTTYCEDTAGAVFRRLVGAAVICGGPDMAVRLSRTLGIIVDMSTTSMKDIAAAYNLHRLARPSSRAPKALNNDLILRIQKVECMLGYQFNDPHLAIQATTHESAKALDPKKISYERLELLGDAVLEFAVTDLYYRRYPTTPIRKLRNFKSYILSNDALGSLFASLGLGVILDTDPQEYSDIWMNDADHVIQLRASGDTDFGGLHLDKILGDSMEALVGAVYADSGFSLEEVNKVLLRTLIPFVDGSNIECHIGRGMNCNTGGKRAQGSQDTPTNCKKQRK